MKTQYAIAQCPSCKKEHYFIRVVSYNSYTPRGILQLYFNSYMKKCECGTVFNREQYRFEQQIPWEEEV